MFKKIRNEYVVNTAGFSVEVFDPPESRNPRVKYIEGDYTITVDMEGAEHKPGEVYFLVYTETMQFLTPAHENPALTNSKREQILSNIDAALTFMKIKHKFGT